MTDAPGAVSSRLRTVLDPAFLQGLRDLPVEDLRRRRDQALAEREFQSYLRRLVQGREDILGAEQHRRRSGEGQRPLMERLTEVLSEGPQGPGRGEALRLSLSREDLVEAERRADEAVDPAALSVPQALTDEELSHALGELDRQQRRISDHRAAVIWVHDRLQEELMRRYREDPSLIPRDL